jgi:hypothetical protein
MVQVNCIQAERDIGGMAEWLKAAVLKTVSRKRDVGSNPTPSAIAFSLKVMLTTSDLNP